MAHGPEVIVLLDLAIVVRMAHLQLSGRHCISAHICMHGIQSPALELIALKATSTDADPDQDHDSTGGVGGTIQHTYQP